MQAKQLDLHVVWKVRQTALDINMWSLMQANSSYMSESICSGRERKVLRLIRVAHNFDAGGEHLD